MEGRQGGRTDQALVSQLKGRAEDLEPSEASGLDARSAFSVGRELRRRWPCPSRSARSGCRRRAAGLCRNRVFVSGGSCIVVGAVLSGTGLRRLIIPLLAGANLQGRKGRIEMYLNVLEKMQVYRAHSMRVAYPWSQLSLLQSGHRTPS